MIKIWWPRRSLCEVFSDGKCSAKKNYNPQLLLQAGVCSTLAGPGHQDWGPLVYGAHSSLCIAHAHLMVCA